MLSPPHRRSRRNGVLTVDEHRSIGLGEEIGVEGDAQRGRDHAVAVGDVPVVGDGAVAVKEGAVEARQGLE